MLVQDLQSSGESVCSSVVFMDLSFIILKVAAMNQWESLESIGVFAYLLLVL